MYTLSVWSDFGAQPSLVLVVRSARDGYTPEEMVDRIQARTLE